MGSLEEVFNDTSEAGNTIVAVVTGVSMLIGALQCFFGYRLFKIFLGILGFVLGAIFGGLVGAVAGGDTGALIGAIVGGILGAALLVVLYFIGIFFLGAVLGGLLAAVACSAAGAEPHPVAIGIAAIVFGILALVLQKLLIIVSTSFQGAWSVVSGVFYFAGVGSFDPVALSKDPSGFEAFFRENIALVACWVVLAIVGIVVQYTLTGRKPMKPVAPHKPGPGISQGTPAPMPPLPPRVG